MTTARNATSLQATAQGHPVRRVSSSRSSSNPGYVPTDHPTLHDHKERLRARLAATPSEDSRPHSAVIEMGALFSAVQDVNCAMTTVDETFRTAEAFLEGLHLEVDAAAWVFSRPVFVETPNPPGLLASAGLREHIWLRYERIDKRYRITIGPDQPSGDRSSPAPLRLHVVPWDLAGQREKLEAVAQLPVLINELARRGKALAEQSRMASQRLRLTLSHAKSNHRSGERAGRRSG